MKVVSLSELRANIAKHFDSVEELHAYAQQLDQKTILVKGSRFMRMERIVDAILLDSEKIVQN